MFTADEGPLGQPRYGLWVTDGTAGGTGRVVELSTAPAAMVTVGRAAYFLLGDALWRTDGTADGTHAVHEQLHVEGNTIAVAGGDLYVVGRLDTDGLGAGLVRSDGTAQGTGRVNVLPPGDGRGFPSHFTAVGRCFFFTIDVPATGSVEL